MEGGVLIGTGWREIQVSPYTLQSSYQQFDVISLQIVDQVLDACDGPLILDEFEFSELTDVLQVATALIVDDEIGVYVFPQFLVIGEEGLKDCFLDVAVVDCDYGSDAAQEGRD
jgi:hypothetical protein